jgi:hypothetical protein
MEGDKNMNRKQHNGEAGYVAERMNPYVPGRKVTIYVAEEQGIDVGGAKYAIVCDAHGTISCDTNIPGARLSMKDPALFCDECRAICAPLP